MSEVHWRIQVARDGFMIGKFERPFTKTLLSFLKNFYISATFFQKYKTFYGV